MPCPYQEQVRAAAPLAHGYHGREVGGEGRHATGERVRVADDPGVDGPPGFGTLTHVWVALAAAVAWGAFTASSAPPNDLWWHLRAGEWILAHGTIPRVDLFSYTQAGSPWIYQAWLSEVFLAWLHGVGGMPLLVAVGGALNVVGYGLAFLSALRGRPASQTSAGLCVGALATLLGMIVGAAAWQVRPQLLSIPMFGGLMAALWARHAVPLPSEHVVPQPGEKGVAEEGAPVYEGAAQN
ncbi:MAG: hypothetical protein ACP5G7_11745, partial [Anaerolineae bacterium]